MREQSLITVKGLAKTYHDQKKAPVKAVDCVDLTIRKGETFGLVGESGCGKSTLGQMLVQLIPPTAGEIYFEDTCITALSTKEKKRFCKDIQMIFQDPYSSINPKKTIGWLIEEPLIIHKMASGMEQRTKLVDEILALVGLDESYKSRYPSELSGGQRQRVAIAIALILRPSFVVCDEAVSALDVSVQAQVLNLLKDLQTKLGLTYLFISHNLNVVSYIADRIAVMYLGRIVEVGTAQQLSEKPFHPYTQALFSASVQVSSEKSQRIILTGDLPSPANPPSGCSFHTRCRHCTEICKTQRPVLEQLSDGRQCACHHYKTIQEV